MKPLRAIDVCGGAGGWAVAARGLPIEITHAIDWWEPACRTYKLNHPEVLVVRADCKAIPLAASGFDLVLGGIPCQWLTQLRSKGLGNLPGADEIERERALLDAILDWIGELAPPFWCLEDVRGIVKQLPILTPYQILDAQRFSGQRRVRAYVGRFPRPRANGCDATAARFIRSGPFRVHPSILNRTPLRRRCWGVRDHAFYPIEPDRKWPTVVSLGSRHDKRMGVLDETLPGGRRQVEWQEAATAQGFPPDYVFVGNQTETNQMIANAVQINMGRAILESICRKARARESDAKTVGEEVGEGA